MSDIEIKNGLKPKSVKIDLDPKEWFLILFFATISYGIYSLI